LGHSVGLYLFEYSALRLVMVLLQNSCSVSVQCCASFVVEKNAWILIIFGGLSLLQQNSKKIIYCVVNVLIY